MATTRPRAVRGRQQLLGDDPLQGDRELGADLALLLGREDVDDPVDRLRGRLGVQGGEDEVAGLGRGQRGRDRLQVAHLADQDHVGVLAQGGLQPQGEVDRVGADLALVDDRALVRVEELDRVLDREDVVLALGVDHVDHRRQRRRLARAGRPGDEDEAARLAGEVAQHLRHPSESRSGIWCGTRRKAALIAPALEEGVDAEPGDVRDRVGEVELLVVLEALALVVVEDAVDDLARLLGVERPRSPPSARSGPCRGSPAGSRRSGGRRRRRPRPCRAGRRRNRNPWPLHRPAPGPTLGGDTQDLLEAGQPGADLGDAVLAQGLHALLAGDGGDLGLWRRRRPSSPSAARSVCITE